MAGVHSNLSPMRYVVGHFLHVFTYILLTRVQLFIDKPRPFAQIEIDAGAHAQIFTTEGIPSGTEALSCCGLPVTADFCRTLGARPCTEYSVA